MLKKLKHNWLFKIGAVLIAIIIWGLVYNSDNPVELIKLAVPISIVNQSAPQSANLQIMNDFDKSVIIEIRGRTTELEQVSTSDFIIQYDFALVLDESITEISYFKFDYLGTNAIDYKIVNEGVLHLDVERLSVLEKKITVQLLGEPAYGYSIVSTSYTPENFSIKDINSLVTNIELAVVNIDISGIKGNTNIRKYCEFYDENGNEIIELNEYISVDVTIEVARDIEVNTAIFGVTNPEFLVVSHTAQPSVVRVSGPEEALSSIESLTAESISVSGAIKSFVTKANIINLPVGCQLIGGSNTVDVAVVLEQLVTRVFTFSKEEIKFIQEDPYGNYSYSILDSTISITLKGRNSELQELTNYALAPYISVKSLQDNIILLPVEINIPLGVKQVSFPQAEVQILKNVTLQMNVDDIYLPNARYETYTYSFSVEKYAIVLSGFSEYLSNITINSLNPSIDVMSLKEGIHQVPLLITLPDNVISNGDLIITLTITVK